MPEKRKLEEYHDPDYPATLPKQCSDTSEINQPEKKPKLPITEQTKDERIKKICAVIKREFQNELMTKELEIDEIERRLSDAKQLLAKVRYAVVYNYYTKKNLVYTESELKSMDTLATDQILINETEGNDPNLAQISESKKFQPAIHPSLKKLLGKRPIDYNEILKVRPTRQAAKTATQMFHKIKKPSGINTTLDLGTNSTITHNANKSNFTNEMDETKKKLPRYIAPNSSDKRIEQVNSARGRNQCRHLLVVGNTSKYIGHEEIESASNVTHKWLVYIATKTVIPVQNILNKVRFFLHESYKPNDIVEVSSAPFQISKRGWGEFAVRVQLYFHPHLQQKPIQIVHNLVLDKKHTGLQTMGSETIVELWLNTPNNNDNTNKEQAVISNESNTQTKLSMTSQLNMPNDNDKSPMCTKITEKHIINERLNIKTEPELCINTTNNKIDVDSNQQVYVTAKHTAVDSCAVVASTNPKKQIVNCTTDAGIVQPTNSMQLAPKNLSFPSSSIINKNGKLFVKYVDKNGKLALIEMIADPKNPKIFKMVLPEKNKNLLPISTHSTASAILVKNAALTTKIHPLPQSNLMPINSRKETELSSTVRAAVTIPQVQDKSKIVQPQPQASTQINKNSDKTIIMKNGKIFFMDKTLDKTPNAQKSLLKPQISLLKSSFPEQSTKPKLPVPIISHKIPESQTNMKMVTISTISGLQNKNVNVFMPTNYNINSDLNNEKYTALKNKKFMINTKVRQQHGIDLEKKFFHSNHFNSVIAGVTWMLKRLPLVTSLASQHGFKDSFPFVVGSKEAFDNMHISKQRCYEWLRAKYIRRLISQHSDLMSFPMWTTKQILLFARSLGYSFYTQLPIQRGSTQSTEENLKEIIMSEIRSEHLKNDSISFNRRISDWITEAEQKNKLQHKHDGIEDTATDELLIVDVNSDNNHSTIHHHINDLNIGNKDKLYLPIPNEFQEEYSWITDICRNLQIQFKPEELVKGVMHRTAQQMLITALRLFLEDLVRRSSATKWQNSNKSNFDAIIKSEDIQRTLTITKHFDFLTNKHFGVEKSMSS